MSKELEALEQLKYYNTLQNDYYDMTKELDIIETALKRLETLEEEKQSFDRATEKKLKALEIIKETPIFAWYITIYKDAYEMVADAKGFRVNNSVEELQEMFDLLKEALKNE